MLKTDNTLTLVIDYQEKMMPSISDKEELLSKSAIFIEGCRILGVPILTTEQYTKGLGETVQEIKTALGNYQPIEKLTFSCFGCAEFKNSFEKANKKIVFITGVEAHICVLQTVLDLLKNSYTVYVIADCIGSRSGKDLSYAIRRMEQAGAIITTAESALFEMMVSASHPKRKDISSLVK